MQRAVRCLTRSVASSATSTGQSRLNFPAFKIGGRRDCWPNGRLNSLNLALAGSQSPVAANLRQYSIGLFMHSKYANSPNLVDAHSTRGHFHTGIEREAGMARRFRVGFSSDSMPVDD